MKNLLVLFAILAAAVLTACDDHTVSTPAESALPAPVQLEATKHFGLDVYTENQPVGWSCTIAFDGTMSVYDLYAVNIGTPEQSFEQRLSIEKRLDDPQVREVLDLLQDGIRHFPENVPVVDGTTYAHAPANTYILAYRPTSDLDMYSVRNYTGWVDAQYPEGWIQLRNQMFTRLETLFL